MASIPRSSFESVFRPTEVAIRTDQHAYLFDSSPAMVRAAYRWTYILRSRTRWQNDSNYRHQLAEKSYNELLGFGISEHQILELASAPLIEVSVAFDKESEGWEARILPWEFLISEATRKAGRRKNLIVIRHLKRLGRVPKIGKTLRRMAFVESYPGPLVNAFDLSGERSRVRQSAFGSTDDLGSGHSFLPIANPNIEQLADRIRGFSPEVIHLAGFDNHQASSLTTIDSGGEKEAGQDGMVLLRESDSEYRPFAFSSKQIAKAINAADVHPALVFCNLYYSAARTAALSVADGAGAAIGFQDQFDKQQAENFVSDFYDALRGGYTDKGTDKNSRRVLNAFLSAFQLTRQSNANLTGSGIVLWSAQSIWDDTFSLQDHLDCSHSIAESIREQDTTVLANRKNAASVVEELAIEVVPKKRLNFSLLHNRQPIFEKFEIRKPRGLMRSVKIEVELHIGGEKPRFSRVINLDQTVTTLEKQIFVPLTWMKTELFWESVLISAHVDISWEGQTLYSQSHPIVMDPADCWVDTDENRQSLPSLVYPRDPAVAKIIRNAQEFLYGLSDNFSTGFDGYQSIDPDSEHPFAAVDFQVQAIWSALIRNAKLDYINPPPTFTDYSQRIRTPEEVVEGGRGTCIDLTMLLASCLEYIEIYPVIFLLEGHAFPGYWRSDQDHQNFIVPTDFTSDIQSPSVWQLSPWLLGQNAYDEVLQQVQLGNIVPMESVWLTHNAGFWEAVEEGWENLRIAGEFHSLIDIQFARNNDVTPLPIRNLRDFRNRE